LTKAPSGDVGVVLRADQLRSREFSIYLGKISSLCSNQTGTPCARTPPSRI